MRGVRVLLAAIIAVCQVQFMVPTVGAESMGGAVIEQIYPGSYGTATQEFVEIFNDAALPVDVTGWCLSYISASGNTTTKLACLSAPDTQTRVWLKAGGYATLVSNEYKTAYPTATADVYFVGGIASAGGHVKLTNASGTEVDRVGWGTAIAPEGTPAVAPVNTKSLQRKPITAGYQDTDNNGQDITQVVPLLHASDLYEVVTIVDVCPNIDGPQTTLPSGYMADEHGACQADSCLNVEGLQISVPEGYDSDDSGNCVQHDECANVTGVQAVIPSNMIRGDGTDCVWDIAPLTLSEILPNADGSDAGNEFIEVYNPTDHVVDLSLYTIRTGVNGDKSYTFPVGSTIAPGEYRSFSDSLMKFTLANTTGRVVLGAIDGSVLGDSGIYNDAPDGESWAMVGGTWQYTNRPTPGTENQPSFIDMSAESTDATLSACPSGKYRNPLTNRCRSIESDAAVLGACGADQYRNPDTGRCKRIDTSSLTPCKDNQYRSEETNRCRTITTVSTQKACKDNQYRSEETNRCRNLPASGVPNAAFAVQPIADTGKAFIGWWALGGIGVVAVGYAAWEWRREIAAYWSSIVNRTGK